MLLHKIYFAQVFSTSSSLLQEWKQRICYGLRFGASAGGLGTPQIAWVMHFLGIYCTSTVFRTPTLYSVLDYVVRYLVLPSIYRGFVTKNKQKRSIDFYCTKRYRCLIQGYKLTLL